MFSSTDSRHPLLPAKHAQRRHRPSHAADAQRRALVTVGGGVLLIVAAVLLYRQVPQQTQEEGSEETQRDSARELQLLHEQPSHEFCTLPPPLVCAHGGDISAAPPNTAAAFAAALDGGARCVEVDVARTKDGQLVVLHSRELAHMLQLAGQGPSLTPHTHLHRHSQSPSQSDPHSHSQAPPQVGDYTWRELQELRWEDGQGVEAAESVVRLAMRRTQQITLDVKTHTQAGEDVDEDSMAQAVVDLVRRTGCTQCLVWAKSDALVRTVKELEPHLSVGYVVLNETAAARAAGMHSLLRMQLAEVVALHYAMASDPAVTSQARAARKQVHAWTANTAGMMRAVLDAGVEAVVTNHPRKLQEAVESRLQRCRQKQQDKQWQQRDGEEEHHMHTKRQQQQGQAVQQQHLHQQIHDPG